MHAWFPSIFQTPGGIVCLIPECSSNKNTQNFTNGFLMNSLKEGIRDLLVLLLPWIEKAVKIQLQNTEDKKKIMLVLSGNNFFSLVIPFAQFCFKRQKWSWPLLLSYNEYLNYYQNTDLLPFTRAAVVDNHHK